MTIITTAVIHTNPGADVGEVFKTLQKGLAKIQGTAGVVEATLAAVAIGGVGTNSMVLSTTTEDWASFGKVQQELNTDQEWIALLLEGGKLTTWETYVSQTIDFSLLPS
jgi:hypothetical protein